MDLTQLIYASRPFGFDNATLNAVLIEARANNPKHDITGALICRADMYLQLLEGDAAAVDSTFARIASDNRHLEVKTLYRMPATVRLFPDWAMRDDPPEILDVDETGDCRGSASASIAGRNLQSFQTRRRRAGIIGR